MKNIFLIFGYGVPKNILEDENYNIYLKTVFNKIYEISGKDNSNPVVVCSGGKTDYYKPFKRSEAGEMVRFFREFIKTRSVLQKKIKKWKLFTETKALSTLENLLFCQDLITKKKITGDNIYVFCEMTRVKRIEVIGKKIFGTKLKVIGTDFDTSANRYLDRNFLVKKEQAELKHILWALESKENLKKHHELLEEKIDFLRKSGPKNHAENVRKWWEEKLSELGE